MPILFRMKPGMGDHYIRRHGQMVCLSPGDQIRCEPHELGGAIKKFEQLEPDPPPPQPKVGLKVVHRGHGKYDVVNQASGAKLNDGPLNKEEAEGLRTSVAEEVTQPETESTDAAPAGE